MASNYTWGLDMRGDATTLTSGGYLGHDPCTEPTYREADIDRNGVITIGDATAITSQGYLGHSAFCTGNTEQNGESRTNYWFLYDGNGNVGQVLDATVTDNITTAAKYEYDPYGNIIGPDPDNDGDWLDHAGPYAGTNPIRFSTKWLDSEVDYPNTTADGLYYYGYRYYSPRLGRWMNRDPMEEDGGFNLYTFVVNNPTNWGDSLGDTLTWTGAMTRPSTRPRPAAPRPGSIKPPPATTTRPTPRSAEQCCSDAKKARLDNDDQAGVVCCDGNKVACAWKYQHTKIPAFDYVSDLLAKCAIEHEMEHFDQINCPSACPSLERGKMSFYRDKTYKKEECDAYWTELACLSTYADALCDLAPDPSRCHRRIDSEITAVSKEIQYFCYGRKMN